MPIHAVLKCRPNHLARCRAVRVPFKLVTRRFKMCLFAVQANPSSQVTALRLFTTLATAGTVKRRLDHLSVPNQVNDCPRPPGHPLRLRNSTTVSTTIATTAAATIRSLRLLNTSIMPLSLRHGLNTVLRVPYASSGTPREPVNSIRPSPCEFHAIHFRLFRSLSSHSTAAIIRAWLHQLYAM